MYEVAERNTKIPMLAKSTCTIIATSTVNYTNIAILTQMILIF